MDSQNYFTLFFNNWIKYACKKYYPQIVDSAIYEAYV